MPATQASAVLRLKPTVGIERPKRICKLPVIGSSASEERLIRVLQYRPSSLKGHAQAAGSGQRLRLTLPQCAERPAQFAMEGDRLGCGLTEMPPVRYATY
ncbi:hypothetical protein GV67_21155 [Pseudorhizobium pelagicum]|uniref:Uncharacterized protein n=1 Tax=Pseudorhizobium pelagicum TaxID=1509405 RepID=A0A922NZS8_9HYPH|nr:hypothetical protein GV67_21155 [Pseudorhizobium pelagicum]KEQ02350.1 hypothetical protein GV68_22280 [Pseudorhizobium pelagicum]